MKISAMRSGNDYLVTGTRDWVKAGGLRYRYTEPHAESRLNRPFGLEMQYRPIILHAWMTLVRDDGTVGEREQIHLSHIRAVWEQGNAAVAAFRGAMDEGDRRDLEEREAIEKSLAAAGLADIQPVYTGAEAVEITRGELLRVLAARSEDNHG